MREIDIDGEDAADGLIALVLAVIELLVEAMEREGVRRMESGQLTDEEVERLGSQFAAIEAEIERLKAEADIEEDVADLQFQLDDLVNDAIRSVAAGEVDATREGGVYRG